MANELMPGVPVGQLFRCRKLKVQDPAMAVRTRLRSRAAMGDQGSDQQPVTASGQNALRLGPSPTRALPKRCEPGATRKGPFSSVTSSR